MNQSQKDTISYYDRLAGVYADSSNSKDMTDMMKPFLDVIRPQGLLLDLGSGAGRDSLNFEELGYPVISLDRSFGLLKEHQQRGGKWLLSADMALLPFPENRFQGVWACASLLHVPKMNIQTVLAGIKRVLLPGGAFFSAVKAGVGEGSELSDSGVPFLPKQPAAQDGRYWSFYQQDEWLQNLQKTGFSVIWSKMTVDQSGRDLHWINALARISHQ